MNDQSPNHQQPESSLPIWLKLLVVILLSAIGTGLVMTVRGQGWLQIAELKSFDLLMKLKGNWMELTGKDEPPDSRILIVTIDDKDKKYLENEFDDQSGALSLPDDALTKLLERLDPLNKQKHLIIGLDIYHKVDFKDKLAERLKNKYRFFVVCQLPSTDSTGMPPPQNIPPENWGFSDVLVDKDEIVRRNLLASSYPSDALCSTGYSFNFLIAAHYLSDRGINFTSTKDREWQSNEVLFRKLTAHSSGYQGVDAKGYQILLNYRYNCSLDRVCSLKNVARDVPLRDVLPDDIHPDTASLLDDSPIILIGVTAQKTPSGIYRDIFNTPYGEQIPGVFLQAQMLSQILSAVLDGRPLIGWWSIGSETLWVLVWSFLGAILGFLIRNKKQLYLVLAVPLAIGAQFTFSLFIFVAESKWIPLVPAVLVVLVTVLPLALPTIIEYIRGGDAPIWVRRLITMFIAFLKEIYPWVKGVFEAINASRNKKD